MKNSKLGVMLLTFLIMILLTPFIFSKLMNSRFDTMLLKTQQQRGIVIKEVEDKSNYLTTDRVFEVKVPGEAIGNKEIEYITLLTEVKFKNLPVTTVVFHNILKKLVLKDVGDVKFLENNFIFDVITPDFKHFTYSVVNKDVKYQGFDISWRDFKGVVVYPKEFKNESGTLKVKSNDFEASFDNLNALYLFLKNKYSQELKLKTFTFKTKDFDIKVNNFESKNSQILKPKKADIVSKFNIKNLDSDIVGKKLKLNSVNFDFKLLDLNKSALISLEKGEDKSKELINSGFRGEANLDIKEIFFIKPLGFIKANLDFNISKGDNYSKLRENKLDFINLDFKVKASPQIGMIVGLSYPDISPFIIMDKNSSKVEIKIKKGKIYINGKEIKSN